MDELKFDIIKHSYHKIIWYSIFFSIIFSLVLFLYLTTDQFKTIINEEYRIRDIGILIIVSLLIFFTFKFLPSLINTKYYKCGRIKFDNNGFEIKTDSIILVNFSEARNCKLFVNSFEGQSINGAPMPFLDVFNRPSNSGLHSADGLRNYLIFEKSSKFHKIEFYIGSIDHYNQLIDRAKDWKQDNKIELSIMR